MPVEYICEGMSVSYTLHSGPTDLLADQGPDVEAELRRTHRGHVLHYSIGLYCLGGVDDAEYINFSNREGSAAKTYNMVDVMQHRG